MAKQSSTYYISSIWAIGWILDWGYYIALALSKDSLAAKISAFGLGWIPAIFWPFHAAVELWLWLLKDVL